MSNTELSSAVPSILSSAKPTRGVGILTNGLQLRYINMLPLLAFALSMFVAIDMQQRKFQQQEEQRQYQQRQYQQRQYQQRQYQQRQYQQRQYQQRQYQQRQEQRQDIIPDRIMWTAVSAAAGGFVGLIYLHSK